MGVRGTGPDAPVTEARGQLWRIESFSHPVCLGIEFEFSVSYDELSRFAVPWLSLIKSLWLTVSGILRV